MSWLYVACAVGDVERVDITNALELNNIWSLLTELPVSKD